MGKTRDLEGVSVCVRDRKGGRSGKQRSIWVEQSCFRYSMSLFGAPGRMHRGKQCRLTASLRWSINKGMVKPSNVQLASCGITQGGLTRLQMQVSGVCLSMCVWGVGRGHKQMKKEH